MVVANKRKTRETERIEEMLRPHFREVEAYRYNSASIRVRIVDERFERKSNVEREDMVWPLLGKLSERTRADISILLLVTEEEKGQRMMNVEFDKPSPSRL